MKITLKLRTIIIAILIAVATLFVLKKIIDHKYQLEIESVQTELWVAKADVESYKIEIAGMTEYVSESDLLILSKDDEIFSLKKEGEVLRALNVKSLRVIGELEAQIEVFITDIPPQVQDGGVWADFIDGVTVKKTLPLPAKYEYKDKYASMSTLIGINGLASQRFEITNLDFNIVIGQQGQGFLKKREDKALVTTDNPYLNMEVSKFAIINNEPARWVYVGLGAGTVTALVIVANLLIK